MPERQITPVNGLTLPEQDQLILLLSKLDAQRMGTQVFDAMAKKTVSVAIEAVCIRPKPLHANDPDILEEWYWAKTLEVYMTQRSRDDTAYPGEWHCPGSVMRPKEDIGDVFDRLGKREFGFDLLSWRFVANVNHPTEARGHFFSLVYLCNMKEGGNLRGRWFPVDRLPEPIIKFHRMRVIPVALGAFLAENARVCV